MVTDPRELGCRCDECPLGALHRRDGTWAPVLPENRDSGAFLVLGEYPGPVEVRMRRPQVGPSGQLLERTLFLHGSHRQEAVLDNALLCRPPGNDLRSFVSGYVRTLNQRIAKLNEERKRNGDPLLPEVPTPQEACRPHVLRQLERTPDVLAVGKTAHWSVTRKVVKIRRVRGAFTVLKLRNGQMFDETRAEYTVEGGTSIRLVSTINPAFALRAAPWQQVFEQDVGRFFRWRRGKLDWTEPRLISMHPDPALVEEFLRTPGPFAFDLETTYDDQLICGLRTIGVYSFTRKAGIVIPWLSIEGGRGFAPGWERPRRHATVEDFETWKGVHDYGDYHYNEGAGQEIVRILVEFFNDGKRPKIGQNSGYFDEAVLWRWLGIDRIQGHLDQILLARACDSELWRDLYTIGTLYTDVPSWKQAEDDRRIAHNPRSYEELAVYNNLDNAVVSRTAPILLKRAREREQLPIVDVDHEVQAACREMHQIGLYVAEPIRARFEDELAASVKLTLKTIRDTVGDSDFNPDSTAQLRKLFYDDWGLPEVRLTATGIPSTDEDTLRTFQVARGLLDARQRAFIVALWTYRTASKNLSNILLPLRPASKGGRVGKSGLIYPHMNAHSASTGRVSSSNPPSQNWQKWLRALIAPRRHDHVFVQADYDQIELRLLSALAGVEAYLEVFRTPGGDPHAITALLIYGERFAAELRKKTEHGIKTKLYDSLRRFAKTFVYAVLYGGTAETVYENVSKATDEDPSSPTYGELLFPDMTLAQVEAATRRWMEAAHQIPAWWNTQWSFAQQYGFVCEPVLGRRRDFPAFERNEVINMPVQGGASSIMHLGLIRLRRNLVPDFGRGLGLINQMHDAVTVECHERDADRVRQLVTESLYSKFDHVPGVEFTAPADITVSWNEAKASPRYIAEGLGLKVDDKDKPAVVPVGGGLWMVTTAGGSRTFSVAAGSPQQAIQQASIRVARGETGVLAA